MLGVIIDISKVLSSHTNPVIGTRNVRKVCNGSKLVCHCDFDEPSTIQEKVIKRYFLVSKNVFLNLF